MDIDFIDDEWVKKVNNKLELGAYKATKEEYRKWYQNMPNQRKGELFTLATFIRKNGLRNIRLTLFSR